MPNLSLAEILDLLSPAALRSEVASFATARESFEADPRVGGWDAVYAEVVRFVAHVSKQRYASQCDIDWLPSLAEHDADLLVRAVFGSPPHRRLLHFVDQQGMRALLDRLTAHLQDERITTYLRYEVILHLHALAVEERYQLAQAYLEEYRVLDGVELQHPLTYALLTTHPGEWARALHEHARQVLRLS